MSLVPGARIGAYELLALIGAGGMGEVYRARDTKLGRPVAIKVLLASVALDADRIARFEREARLLAALNHPHIAALYGMEGDGGQQFLVMELVEGETLADRVARGPVPVESALHVALQIADALEAAHEKGIIHRDLKPANVKITPDDRVKVLDFGLARTVDVAQSDLQTGRSHSPTLSLMATQAGLILGTAAYMSPEQAKGLQADHRSDVFSFGCVLYEMLTGRQAFQGETAPDILASVLAREPDLGALPPTLDPRLTELLRRCLDKNPKRRWQAAGDLRVELETLAKSPYAEVTGAAPAAAPRSPWRTMALYGAPALLIGAALGTLTMRVAMRPPPARISRTMIVRSGAAVNTFGDHEYTVTPDGSRVVFVGNNGTQLFVRSLDALEPIAIATGTGLRGPFMKPDGEWVGFFDSNQRMLKVQITGGPAITIVDRTDGTSSRGASWGRDDSIVFGTSLTATGLQKVKATGGPVTVLTRPDRALGQGDHDWPQLLPGGQAVLFTVLSPNGADDGDIEVLDLASMRTKLVVHGGADARYLTSGHIVYAASGTLRAVAFDARRLEVPPGAVTVPLLPGLAVTGTGAAGFAVSDEGTLVYADAPPASSRTLVWADRSGRQQDLPVPPHLYQNPRVSPDGMRIAVATEDQQRDIFIFDRQAGHFSRLTSDPAIDTFPAWTPDSLNVVFGSARAGNVNLWWQRADNSGPAQRLLTSTNIQVPTAVTPDGYVIYHEVMPETSTDLMRVSFAGPHKPEVLLQTRFTERQAVTSPDGRWLVYESNSGGDAIGVFVRPLAPGQQPEYPLSTAGGSRPVWRGNEIFYLAPGGSLMRVTVTPGKTWSAGTPTKIVERPPEVTGSGDFNRNYDVSPDGQHFVFVKSLGASQAATASPIVVVQHWDQELARLVPTK